MPSSGLTPSRLIRNPASPSQVGNVDPALIQSNPGSTSTDDPGFTSMQTHLVRGDMSSAMKQIEAINRYITVLESNTITSMDGCDEAINLVNQQCLELMGSYNEVTKNLSHVVKQVHGLRQEWNPCNDDETPLVQEEEEVFHDITDQSTLVVPSNDQSGQQEPTQRSLMDLTPIQHQREVLTPITLERRAAPTPPKHYVEGYANSASLYLP